jgi:hypothetical protein
MVPEDEQAGQSSDARSSVRRRFACYGLA